METSEFQWVPRALLAHFSCSNACKLVFVPGHIDADRSVSFFLKYGRAFRLQVQISGFLLLDFGRLLHSMCFFFSLRASVKCVLDLLSVL